MLPAILNLSEVCVWIAYCWPNTRLHCSLLTVRNCSPCRLSPTLINSDMPLIAVLGSISSNNPFVIIHTWAPESHRAVSSLSFNRLLTAHFLPTRLTTFACCVGVKRLINAVCRVNTLCDSSLIAWHIIIWSGHSSFRQDQEQYHIAWHWEERGNGTWVSTLAQQFLW